MSSFRGFDERLYIKEIVPIIKMKSGLVTAGDLALETSFPLIHIKFALGKLASKYIADVSVTDEGALLYNFGDKLTKVGKYDKLFRRSFLGILAFIKKALKLIIMLTLIVYTLFFLILIIVGIILSIIAMLASIFSDSDSSSDGGSFDVLDIGIALQGLVGMFEVLGNIIVFLSNDPYLDNVGRGKQPFYVNVFSFVFGDDKGVEVFNHEENIFQFLRDSKGITLSEAINLTGLFESDVRNLLVNMAIKYDGDIDVNNDGIIIYTFDEISFTTQQETQTDSNSDDNLDLSYAELKEARIEKAKMQKAKIAKKVNYTYAWNRKASLGKLNYNTFKENFYIISFNLFNLTMSYFAGLFFIKDAGNNESIFSLLQSDNILVILLFVYPFVFSVLFFAIPILRAIFLWFSMPKLRELNSFLNLLKRIFYSKRKYLDFYSVKGSMRKKIFTHYPSLFVHDFIEEKEIINLENYKAEIIKPNTLTHLKWR